MASATPTIERRMRKVGFPIFDADNHFYEMPEALTKYLPANRRDVVKFVEVDGRKKIMFLGKLAEFIPNPTFERIGHPGAQEQYFKHGNPEGKSSRELVGPGMDCPPSLRNAADRLALMDEQGIDYALTLPTLVSLVEERMREDPDACHDVLHAFNQWMAEEWSFLYEGRIYATPCLTTALVDRAVAELEWLIERGARTVLVRPAPAWGYRGPRSFGLPEFDPFWRLVEESGTVVVLHVSDSGYDRYYDEWHGAQVEMKSTSVESNPFKMSQLFNHYPIQDTITSLICHGTFWRFPGARVLLVENGCGWIPGLLDHLDHVALKAPQLYEMKPSDTFRQNVWVQANHEDNLPPVIDAIGIERLMFGSDYPHLEGLREPLSYLDDIAYLSEEDKRRFMGGNMIDLLGIDVSTTA
jgi:predicted TIM-barrel fold metal-dependent hydrolase